MERVGLIMDVNKYTWTRRTGVGAIIHYALVRHDKRDQGVMNYGPYTVHVRIKLSKSIITSALLDTRP